MQLSVWFAVLLAIAPLAVDVSGPRDIGNAEPDVAQRAGAAVSPAVSPTICAERLQHLRLAQEHLQAAGLADLAAQVGRCAERELLAHQLAEKLAAVRKLQQEIAMLRDRLVAGKGVSDPARQVMVQLKIVQVSRSKLRTLGLDWFEWTELPEARVPSSAGFRLGILNDPEALSRWVEVLQSQGLVQVLAEPRLLTLSGRSATFSSGIEVPLQVRSADGHASVQFRRFGTTVDILPLILDSGKIRLGLRPEIREMDRSQSVAAVRPAVPGTRISTVDTAVEVGSGQTVAIVGWTRTGPTAARHDEQDPHDQDPDEQDETEFMVLATPQLVPPYGSAAMRQATHFTPQPQPPTPVALPRAAALR